MAAITTTLLFLAAAASAPAVEVEVEEQTESSEAKEELNRLRGTTVTYRNTFGAESLNRRGISVDNRVALPGVAETTTLTPRDDGVPPVDRYAMALRLRPNFWFDEIFYASADFQVTADLGN